MAISNFISTVWSESLLSALDGKYIGVANCNREFEGDIKNRGDRVKICGVGPVTVFNYTKNTDFTSGAESLSDTEKTLVIDQAKAFNFQIDDIDRAQSSPRLMNEAMRTAAAALAAAADKHVYSLFSDAGATVKNSAATSANILDTLIEARTKLLEKNVTDPGDIVIEVSPAVASLIFKGKLAYVGDEILESGCIGNVAGCRVYVSNNIATATDSTDKKSYSKCIARSRRAIAFAEQLSEVDAYRPEKRFADAVKGLHLYGAKVVYPNEMVLLDISVSAGA